MGTRSRAELPGALGIDRRDGTAQRQVWLMRMSELKVEGFVLGCKSESLEHLGKKQTGRQRLYYRQKKKKA